MEIENLTRQGAILGHTPEDEDLPMVVWLRGDEEIIDEFTMDAEAAMTALGIKRSRLTQISGRELRVGRIRIDRYTRPVYRPQDVQAYLEWTRASASHQKSSQAIEMAAQKLEEQRGELDSTLKTSLERFEAEILERWTLLDRQRERLVQERSRRLEENLAERDAARTKGEARLVEALTRMSQQVDELERSLARRDAFLETLLQSYRDLKEEVRASTTELAKRLDLQEGRSERQAAELSGLVRDGTEKDRALWEDVSLQMKVLKRELTRKRKRAPRPATPLPRKIASRKRRERVSVSD